jgi:ribonuclease PH
MAVERPDGRSPNELDEHDAVSQCADGLVLFEAGKARSLRRQDPGRRAQLMRAQWLGNCQYSLLPASTPDRTCEGSRVTRRPHPGDQRLVGRSLRVSSTCARSAADDLLDCDVIQADGAPLCLGSGAYAALYLRWRWWMRI